jgi:hypothetical protein
VIKWRLNKKCFFNRDNSKALYFLLQLILNYIFNPALQLYNGKNDAFTCGEQLQQYWLYLVVIFLLKYLTESKMSLLIYSISANI